MGSENPDGDHGRLSLFAKAVRLIGAIRLIADTNEVARLISVGVGLIITALFGAQASATRWPPTLFSKLPYWWAVLCVFAIFYGVFSTIMLAWVLFRLIGQTRSFTRYRNSGREFRDVSVVNASTDVALFSEYMAFIVDVSNVVQSQFFYSRVHGATLRQRLTTLFKDSNTKIGANIDGVLAAVIKIVEQQAACECSAALYLPWSENGVAKLTRIACSKSSGSSWPKDCALESNALADQVMRPTGERFCSDNIEKEAKQDQFRSELFRGAKGLMLIPVLEFDQNGQELQTRLGLLSVKNSSGHLKIEMTQHAVIELSSRLGALLFRLNHIRRHELVLTSKQSA